MGTCLSILCRILCVCYWNIFSCWARHSVLTYQSLTFSACLVSLSNDTEWHSLVSLKRPDLRAGYIYHHGASGDTFHLESHILFQSGWVWRLRCRAPHSQTSRLSKRTKATPAPSSWIFESGRRHFFENSIRMLSLLCFSPDPKPVKHCQGGPSCLVEGLTPERCHHFSG